jgi:hypothetical protein
MVMAVIVIAVMGVLAALVLFNGAHADRSSGRGENWNAAIHVAEAGIDEVMATAQSSGVVVTPADPTGAVTEGSYVVDVTPLGRNHYQVDSVGTVGSHSTLITERGIRVVLAPPPSFKYALFSLTDVTTKNNNYVKGDIWANGSVTVYSNDTVEGHANAANGYVMLQSGSTVTGNAWTGSYNAGGYSMVLENGAEIGGDAKASSTTPDCTDDLGHFNYKIDNGGTIGGTATLWSNLNPGGSIGELQTGVCTLAPATKPIPEFRYNPLNYDPAPSEYASVAAFQTWLNTGTNMTDFSGVHYVSGSGVIDLNGVVVTGDAAVIAPQAAIYADGGQGLSDIPGDKVLVLASWYAPPAATTCTNNGGNPEDCAIGIKNNFQPENDTAVLLYAPNGPIAFKNSADFLGAVYGNNIVLKNNMDLTYDSRVEQVVGFGPVTLEVESWVERPVDDLD